MNATKRTGKAWTRTVRMTLERVADLLETSGWCQRAFSKAQDGTTVDPHRKYAMAYCVAGGVSRVCFDMHGWPNSEYAAIAGACLAAIREEASKRDDAPVELLGPWNDRTDQTAENVIAVVRAAAKAVRA